MRDAIQKKLQPSVEPVDDEIDHVRGGAADRLILEYCDYECPYSRQAFREVQAAPTLIVLRSPPM